MEKEVYNLIILINLIIYLMTFLHDGEGSIQPHYPHESHHNILAMMEKEVYNLIILINLIMIIL